MNRRPLVTRPGAAGPAAEALHLPRKTRKALLPLNGRIRMDKRFHRYIAWCVRYLRATKKT